MTAAAIAHPSADPPPRETVYRCATPGCDVEWCRVPGRNYGTRARKFCSAACSSRQSGHLYRLRVIGAAPPTDAQGRSRVENEPVMRRHLRHDAPADYPAGIERPRTRADCAAAPRPCPWVSCRHHLYLDVEPSGSIKINQPALEVWQMPETCSLDVADRGSSTLEETGAMLNLTRERVRQVERKSMGHVERLARKSHLQEVLP